MHKILTILFSVLISVCFAQESKKAFNGIVVGNDKTPLDVFSVVIFNTKDSTKQMYANTFSNGNFNIDFTPQKGNKYDVYLLSMGYKDTKLSLEQMRDTVVILASSIKMEDVVVQGKRKVTTSISSDGGVLFDVGNTHLSDLGESAQLLNFIPGVNVDKDGNVSVIGIEGDVLIYVNNIKQDDSEKFKSIKSENIKSVEILRMPGAKYKNAAAVILIKTNRVVDGISTNIGISGYFSDNNQYSISPNLDVSYTKGKATVSVAYGYNTGESVYDNDVNRTFNENVLPKQWNLSNRYNNRTQDKMYHWYKADVNYTINDKNTLIFQYRGQYKDSEQIANITESITATMGEMNENKLYKSEDSKNIGNTAHIYYRGAYSPKFSIEFNADYSNKSYDKTSYNNWVLNDKNDPTIFIQPSIQNADAFTTDVILSNTIKGNHLLSYGAEYAYIKDDITSTDIENIPTSYIQNSHFVKGILEYKTRVTKSLGLYIGVNYMYSKVVDNNTSPKGHNYSSTIPYVALQYYNKDKKYGINFNIKYNYVQPTAGLLDDATVSYISPYEIKTGNRNLRNSENVKTSLSFNYKNLQIGIENETHMNYIFKDAEIVRIQKNGQPLFVSTPMNLDKPVTGTYLVVGYSNKFGFWTPSLSAMLTYTYGQVPQSNDIYTPINGWRGQFSLKNHFELPKKFHFYLDGRYNTAGYSVFLDKGQSYALNLSAEKRLLNDQLRVSIYVQGLVANKWNNLNYTLYNISKTYSQYGGWYRYIGFFITWRFNNHKAIQNSKDNEYLNML